MSETGKLYGRLPSVYRRRDAEQGEPLRALLALVEEQLRAVQADVETTWDNWFVETAEEWLVPYLGQALGLPVTRDVTAIAFSRRAFVANAIAYRRRKGTAGMVELLARDVTNYPARVVEFFTRIAWHEAINHQTERPATLDIRSAAALERLSGPFGEAARTIEVRRIASRRGTFNLPNLGLFLWRMQLWRLTGANAEVMAGTGSRAWWFRPLGGEGPLYAPLETEQDPAAVATEASVPLALSRRRLWDQAGRLGEAMVWPFSIAVDGDAAAGQEHRPVPPGAIDICNLETIPATTPADRVQVDPQRGVLVIGADFTADLADVEVVTSHFIATPGNLGAGLWSRDEAAQAWLAAWVDPPETRTVGFQVLVVRDGEGPDVAPSLDAAVQGWNAFLGGLDDEGRSTALGLILVGDSRIHLAPATVIEMPTGAVLGIIAARWPQIMDVAGALVRRRGDLLADDVRPVVRGDLRVAGRTTGAGNRGELYVNGLYADGRLIIEPGDLQALRVESATMLGELGIDGTDGANAGLELTVIRSIVGGIASSGAFAGLKVEHAAVAGALETPLAAADLTGTTVLGPVRVGRLDATDCLFDERVAVEQQQTGCVRFSYLPAESRTPKRFRCQPDIALEETAPGSAAEELVRLRVRPQFCSRDVHAPGFLLLDDTTAAEVRGAAEDGGEPGCWNHLQHGTRMANLTNALPQFLRFGLEPGIFLLC